MSQSYYNLLEIPPNASEDDIRKAYRKKAKELHPDINKSPDAHAKFILLNKAYETLMDQEKRNLYNQRVTPKKDPFQAYQDWVEAQKAKARAEAYRKHQEFILRREEFRNSAIYFPAKVFIHIATVVCYIFGLIVLAACAFVIYEVHFIMVFFLLPFICGGLYFMKCTGDWYQEVKRYF